MKKILLNFFLLSVFFTTLSFLPIPYFNSVSIAQASDVVNDDSGDIKLNVKSMSLVKGDSYVLRVRNTSTSQKITFKSDNTNIASVNDDTTKSATISGDGVGTATISVTVKEGYKTISTLECKVEVGPPAISVKFSKDKINLGMNKRATLVTILKPNNTTETPKYTSSNPLIAKVSSSGRVYGVTTGTVEITASIINGKSDTCIVTITESTGNYDLDE